MFYNGQINFLQNLKQVFSLKAAQKKFKQTSCLVEWFSLHLQSI
jgi:hypothetical protein